MISPFVRVKKVYRQSDNVSRLVTLKPPVFLGCSLSKTTNLFLKIYKNTRGYYGQSVNKALLCYSLLTIPVPACGAAACPAALCWVKDLARRVPPGVGPLSTMPSMPASLSKRVSACAVT